jgi:hydroxylysine kinase
MMHHLSFKGNPFREPVERSLSLTNNSTSPLWKTPLVEVERIAAANFGVNGVATSLSSERDETFLIETHDAKRFVLKIANPDERPDLLRLQTDALLHLASNAPDLPVPRALPSSDNQMLVPLRSGDGRVRLVRLLTFLDGVQLYKAPRSAGQLTALGRALAALGTALSNFKPTVPQQDLLWDISNAPALRELVPETEPSRQSAIFAALDAYDALAAARLNDLPRQLIHNDFNPHNILVDFDNPDRVTGIIDFGDLVEAPRVNDIAVALSYLVGAEDGVNDCLVFLRAYHAAQKLGIDELDCLPVLLRTRLAMTLVITEWRSRRHPDNSDYILRNHPIALAGLATLARYSDSDLAVIFRRELGDKT